MSHIDFDTQALISASECLGVKFKRFDMLACALTHPSIMPNRAAGVDSHPSIYQRLEFLGDRVLGLVIAERLLGAFPNESEGELARRYAALVSTATLADVARRTSLRRVYLLRTPSDTGILLINRSCTKIRQSA